MSGGARFLPSVVKIYNHRTRRSPTSCEFRVIWFSRTRRRIHNGSPFGGWTYWVWGARLFFQKKSDSSTSRMTTSSEPTKTTTSRYVHVKKTVWWRIEVRLKGLKGAWGGVWPRGFVAQGQATPWQPVMLVARYASSLGRAKCWCET